MYVCRSFRSFSKNGDGRVVYDSMKGDITELGEAIEREVLNIDGV